MGLVLQRNLLGQTGLRVDEVDGGLRFAGGRGIDPSATLRPSRLHPVDTALPPVRVRMAGRRGKKNVVRERPCLVYS